MIIFIFDVFIKGNHKNHRVMYFTDRAGCCDCGDKDAIDDVGFCQQHKGYFDIDKEKILNMIPPEFF